MSESTHPPTPESPPPDVRDGHRIAHSQRLIRPLLFVVGVLTVLGTCGWLWWSIGKSPDAGIPEVDLANAHPDVAAAISAARSVVRDQPESAQAWGRLGMVLQAHDFASAAEECLARAESLNPQMVHWPYLRGVGLAVSDPQAALECYRRAAGLPGSPPVIRLRLAELLIELERFDEARPKLESVLEREPNNARAALGLARLLHQQGELDAARQWATKSVQYAPGQRAPRELLAQIAYQQGDRDAADAQLEAMQGLPVETTWEDPIVANVLRLRRRPGAMVLRAQELLERGQVSQAIALLEGLVRHRPQAAEYHELGLALVAAGEDRRAAELLERALEEHPDSPELCRLRGATLYAEDRWSDAADLFRQAIRLKPDDAVAHYNLGHCLLQLNDPEGALRAFREATACKPDFANAHTNIGRLLAAAGRRTEALDHLRIAVELVPDDPEATKLYAELTSEP